MYGYDDLITGLERQVQRMADVHGASVRDVRDDKEVLIALLSGDRASAEDIIVGQYAYCEEHDDTHGNCEVN